MFVEWRNTMELKAKVKSLPSSPGVYLMKDAQGGVLYVGKALNLKRRVQSYFQSSRSHSPKTEKLVKHLKGFDYILTDTEFEAFLLECRLIKELKPLYNKKMKSPQAYTYLIIERVNGYSKITTCNSPIKKEGQLVFGPFTSKGTVERALQGVKEHLKVMCNSPSIKKSTCLNYSLSLCIGVCQGVLGLEHYNNIVDRIIALLDGADLSILMELEQKMSYASNKYDFETAAKYRNHLDAINLLLSKEKVIEFTEENKNIAIIEVLSDKAIKLFLIKGNKVLFSEKYQTEEIDIEELNTIIKSAILSTFNTATLKTTIEVDRNELDESQIIYSYIKASSLSYLTISEEWLKSDLPVLLTPNYTFLTQLEDTKEG